MTRTASFLFLAAALLGAPACSAQGLPRDAPADRAHRNVPATSGRANLPPATQRPFTVQTIGQFDEPFAMNFLPDSSLMVTEKAGRLKVRGANGSVVAISGLPAVAKVDQGGLLDVVAAPGFTSNHRIYWTYSESAGQGTQLAMARGTLTGRTLTDVAVLWRSGSAGPGGQFGAVIAFAPDGRSLYLSSGERQRFTPAQDPAQKLGKILHLTLDGQPMPGTRDGILTSGHRNPYGLQFARDGRLWEVEMGPKGGDELNVVVPGRNYGWPIVSNGDNYDGVPINDHPTHPEFEAPKLWWNPSISPGALMIYSGAMFPQWRGSAFIAALSGEALIRVALAGDTARAVEQWSMDDRIRDVVQAPDGAIWLLGDDGKLMRLTPRV
ncbi:PQQ-dependent sugar dehydrogenase [Sphingomonas bacterium]|uniref:PQQ-dependent sugar dehydrogenase n=1 Tax=Sphingomonas bacterium TaxID=1895847 RepID=UPI0015776038|nr:PQQ-dependent sugar dehydrogenase [Sphingomonas bacterium]